MTKTDEELGDINRLAYAEVNRWLGELNDPNVDVSLDDTRLADFHNQMEQWFLHLGAQALENPDSKYKGPFEEAQMAIQKAQSIIGTIREINDGEYGQTRAPELLIHVGIALREASSPLYAVGPI